MSTFTVITSPGPNWLDLRPGHFDRDQLPRKHRKPEPEGLFAVADVAPAVTAKAKSRPAAELEGQEALFGPDTL